MTGRVKDSMLLLSVGSVRNFEMFIIHNSPLFKYNPRGFGVLGFWGLGLNFLINNIEKYRNISKKSEIF